MLIEGDAGTSWSMNFVFFMLNSQPKFLSGMGEVADQLLAVLFSLHGHNCIISKQHFFDDVLQAGQVKQFSIFSGVWIYALFRLSEHEAQ